MILIFGVKLREMYDVKSIDQLDKEHLDRFQVDLKPIVIILEANEFLFFGIVQTIYDVFIRNIICKKKKIDIVLFKKKSFSEQEEEKTRSATTTNKIRNTGMVYSNPLTHFLNYRCTS